MSWMYYTLGPLLCGVGFLLLFFELSYRKPSNGKTRDLMPVQSTKRMLDVPCDLKRLKEVRKFVSEICRECGICENTMYDLQLAASELAANVIRHALDCDTSKSFSLEMRVTPQSSILEFRHDGHPFDPDTAEIPEPKFDGSQDHGFGLFLIRKIMDQCTYTKEKDGMNRVVLVRRLN